MKDLSLHILDIVQNSIRAKASLIRIEVIEKPDSDQMIIAISDDGSGMNEEQLKLATDPFFTTRTTRKVGLGLSLLRQNAEATGGTFEIKSAAGQGTKITSVFGLSHIDRPVTGDLTGTLLILIASPGYAEYVYRHQTPSGEFTLDTREIKQTLGDVPLTHPEIRSFLKAMIQENLEQIQISE